MPRVIAHGASLRRQRQRDEIGKCGSKTTAAVQCPASGFEIVSKQAAVVARKGVDGRQLGERVVQRAFSGEQCVEIAGSKRGRALLERLAQMRSTAGRA